MKRTIMLVALSCVPPAWAVAGSAPQEPPAPFPAPPILAPALPERAPGAVKEGGHAIKRKPPTIRLGEKHEKDTPSWQGAGFITAGKTKVKAENGKLTASLTGAVFSHSFFGASSVSVGSLQLVQEFEIVSGAPDDPQVHLSLSGKLDGYVRTENDAAAGLRVASVSVNTASGVPAVWLKFASARVSNTSRLRCKSEAEPTEVLLPPGRYVLVADLVLDTAADGCFRSHAESIFAPGNHFLGTWKSANSPRPEIETDDFGLSITLKVAAPYLD